MRTVQLVREILLFVAPLGLVIRKQASKVVLRNLGSDSVPWGGGLSGVMPGVAQLPVVMPVVEVVSVSRVVSSSASDASVR